jgi:FkbM family methyltransferase
MATKNIMRNLQGWYLPDTDTDFDRWMLDGDYQKLQRDTIIKFVKQEKKILSNAIDVGAHVGFWLKDMCSEFKHVYAFEPVDEVRECLFKNVKAENYHCYTYGLGSKDEIKKIHYNPEETGNSYISKDGNKEIMIRRLDNLDLPHIDYIKIDAEGYEIEVVKGGLKLVEKYKPLIHVEVKDKILEKQGLTSVDIDKFFETIDYELKLKFKSEKVYGSK